MHATATALLACLQQVELGERPLESFEVGCEGVAIAGDDGLRQAGQVAWLVCLLQHTTAGREGGREGGRVTTPAGQSHIKDLLNR